MAHRARGKWKKEIFVIVLWFYAKPYTKEIKLYPFEFLIWTTIGFEIRPYRFQRLYENKNSNLRALANIDYHETQSD